MFDASISKSPGGDDSARLPSDNLRSTFLSLPSVLSRAKVRSENIALAEERSSTERAAIERNRWHCVPYSPANELRPRDVEAQELNAAIAAPQAKPFNVWELEFRYWPVWDVGSEALLAFLPEAVPAITQRPGSLLAGSGASRAPAVNGADLSADDAFELDFRTLYDLARKIEQLASRDKRFPMICPVHFETMASLRLRQEYLSLCSHLPGVWRRLLNFEVVCGPSDVTPIRIQSIARDLQAYGRSLHWRADLGSPSLPDLNYTGVAALGLRLGEDLIDEGETMQAMDSFALKMKQLGMETFVHGASSKSLATNAFCANFRYISGQAIHPAILEIESLRSFEPLQLVAGPRRR